MYDHAHSFVRHLGNLVAPTGRASQPKDHGFVHAASIGLSTRLHVSAQCKSSRGLDECEGSRGQCKARARKRLGLSTAAIVQVLRAVDPSPASFARSTPYQPNRSLTQLVIRSATLSPPAVLRSVTDQLISYFDAVRGTVAAMCKDCFKGERKHFQPVSVVKAGKPTTRSGYVLCGECQPLVRTCVCASMLMCKPTCDAAI